jgi:hypothetical protein
MIFEVRTRSGQKWVLATSGTRQAKGTVQDLGRGTAAGRQMRVGCARTRGRRE